MNTTASLMAIAMLSTCGLALADDDAYRKGVAGAKAEAARIRAAEQRRDAEEAARRRAAAEDAARREQERRARQNGTGEQRTVEKKAVYSGRGN
ncbi:MAG: hypothetical protein ABIP20_15395 [Chthoniobacteraceae bacterium]